MLTFADQNIKEAGARRTFNTEFKNADTFSKKKAAVKKFYSSLGPDIATKLGKKEVGTRPEFKTLLEKAGLKLNKNMNDAIQKIKTAINQGGGDVCEAIVGAAKPKMFTGGALPSKCQQAIQILEDDPIRAMNNIDLIQKSSKAIQ